MCVLGLTSEDCLYPQMHYEQSLGVNPKPIPDRPSPGKGGNPQLPGAPAGGALAASAWGQLCSVCSALKWGIFLLINIQKSGYMSKQSIGLRKTGLTGTDRGQP